MIVTELESWFDVSEHQEQSLVMAWAGLLESKWPELRTLHAVQNWAGVKSPIEGARRKREGIRAGMPDLHLPVPRGPYASLYIEMKCLKPRQTKTKGVVFDEPKPSWAQVEMQALLKEYGNLVAVCYSAEAAQETIRSYLECLPEGT